MLGHVCMKQLDVWWIPDATSSAIPCECAAIFLRSSLIMGEAFRSAAGATRLIAAIAASPVKLAVEVISEPHRVFTT